LHEPAPSRHVAVEGLKVQLSAEPAGPDWQHVSKREHLACALSMHVVPSQHGSTVSQSLGFGPQSHCSLPSRTPSPHTAAAPLHALVPASSAHWDHPWLEFPYLRAKKKIGEKNKSREGQRRDRERRMEAEKEEEC
jgi:hypothetical protein